MMQVVNFSLQIQLFDFDYSSVILNRISFLAGMDGYTLTGLVVLFLIWLYILYRISIISYRLIKKRKRKKGRTYK